MQIEGASGGERDDDARRALSRLQDQLDFLHETQAMQQAVAKTQKEGKQSSLIEDNDEINGAQKQLEELEDRLLSLEDRIANLDENTTQVLAFHGNSVVESLMDGSHSATDIQEENSGKDSLILLQKGQQNDENYSG